MFASIRVVLVVDALNGQSDQGMDAHAIVRLLQCGDDFGKIP